MTPLPPSSQSSSDRNERIAEIDAELSRLRALMAPLIQERDELEQRDMREEWPEGPFTLHYWRHHSPLTEEFDRPADALLCADGIEDAGSGSAERIVDRTGALVYDLSSYPYKRASERYPDPDEVLG